MFSRPLILLALLGCCQTALLAAAPPNDNFSSLASANPLHFSGTAAETSTTVDATMEVTEPFPPGFSAANYQGTVWWKWTPATSGWREITTTGSAVDTVVAIWDGASYASPLALVHVNNNNIAMPTDGTLSRIRFFASNAITYKIAVASGAAAFGPVSLKAESIPSSFAMVTAASFSPAGSINVAAPTIVTADVTMTSTGGGSEIQSGLITLYNPSNAVLATATMSGASNRISGSVANGVYRMTLNIPQDSPVGLCRWGIQVTRVSAAVSSYGWEGMTPLPAVATASITLTNSYAAWLTANSMAGPDSLRDADYDQDGLKNLLEFASGSDPRSDAQTYLALSGATITQTGLPLITNPAGNLRVEFVRRLNDASVTYTVQFSDDLVNWDNATNAPTVIATNAAYQAVRVDDVVSIPAKTRRFGRVRITQ